MQVAKLHAHPFVRVVFDDSMQVRRDAGITSTYEIVEDLPVDEKQFYITRVGYSLAHTLTWIEQLHHAVHFLAQFNYEKRTKEAGVNRFHHLIYNVENYLVRLQSVYDRLLQLTNNVFHICNSEELVSHSVIVSNLHVSRTKVPQLLRAVRKTIEPKASDRHDIVHKRSYTDRELERLELFYLHTEATWGPEESGPSFRTMSAVRARLMKDATISRKKEFAAMNAAIVNAIHPLFTELHIQYSRKKSRIP